MNQTEDWRPLALPRDLIQTATPPRLRTTRAS